MSYLYSLSGSRKHIDFQHVWAGKDWDAYDYQFAPQEKGEGRERISTLQTVGVPDI